MVQTQKAQLTKLLEKAQENLKMAIKGPPGGAKNKIQKDILKDMIENNQSIVKKLKDALSSKWVQTLDCDKNKDSLEYINAKAIQNIFADDLYGYKNNLENIVSRTTDMLKRKTLIERE